MKHRSVQMVGAILHDEDGSHVNVENGGLDVNVQDQNTPPLDLYFQKLDGTPTTLSANTAINDSSITVADASTFGVGTYAGIFSGSGRYYFGTVLTKVSNTLTLDTPLDFVFSAGNNVLPFTRDMTVDGSVTPVIFNVSAGGDSTNIEVDIYNIVLQMIVTTEPDDSKFGNLAELTNGIVLRRVDGITRNIHNIKSNADLSILSANSIMYSDKAGGGYFSVRATYPVRDKNGVAIRLTSGDMLQMIIQDDLTSLIKFRALAKGHETI